MKKGKMIQVKVGLPPTLYGKLQEEAELTSNTMASLVRLAVKDRYFGSQDISTKLIEEISIMTDDD